MAFAPTSQAYDFSGGEYGGGWSSPGVPLSMFVVFLACLNQWGPSYWRVAVSEPDPETAGVRPLGVASPLVPDSNSSTIPDHPIRKTSTSFGPNSLADEGVRRTSISLEPSVADESTPSGFSARPVAASTHGCVPLQSSPRLLLCRVAMVSEESVNAQLSGEAFHF